MNLPPYSHTSTSVHPVRRAGFAAAAVVVAGLGATAAPAVAQAAPLVVAAYGAPDDLFTYSADGVEHSEAVPAFFTNSPKLVPGEAVEEKLWVRNDHSTSVNVSVSALAPVGAGESARAGLTPSPVVTLEPGAAAPMNVRLWLPESAGNSTQAQSWDVRLQMNVSEAVPSGDRELGSTGATVGIWPLSVAMLLGGVGAYLGARKRRTQL